MLNDTEILYLIIFLFLIILGMSWYSLYEINKFMSILKTCDDDFAIIKKCNCVPCSWKDARIYNGNSSCPDG